MAFVRNMNKTSRVMGALKQMKPRFLSKPEIQALFSRKTKLVFENYKDYKPLHSNSLLRMQAQSTPSHSWQANYNRTAQFHHLAENALLAWTSSLTNRNLDLKFSGPETISGIRNYAKDVDSKQSPSIKEKKDPVTTKVDDSDSAARFAEAKRMLKEKRMSKGLDYPRRSPFEEP